MFKSIIVTTANHDTASDFILQTTTTLNISIDNNPDFLLVQNIQNKAIGIDKVRSLKDWATRKPYSSDIKVGVIKFAEFLTIQAQNSLLKILEEPNRYTQIYLITKNHKRLLPTILSRCELQIHQAEEKMVENKLVKDDFLDLTKTEKFLFADKILKNKDTGEQKTNIETLLINLIYYYRQNYYNDISDKHLWNINFLSETLKKLHANVPKKLLLDNLIINLK